MELAGPARRFAAPERAVARAVAPTYDRCVRRGGAPIDPRRAAVQHAEYCALLGRLDIRVEVAAADDEHPDGCFVEDTAVLLDQHALVTRPGCASRRGEVDLAREVLSARGYRVHEMTAADGTLDGGDVLRAGSSLFVGRTARTCARGIERLREVARLDGLDVVPVEVRAGLHLKSGVTLLDPERVVCRERDLDLAPLRGRGLVCVPAPEPEGANVLALGRAVVVSAAAPRTADLIAGLGFEVHVVEVGELHAGDGALTCLSLRLPPAGCWCV